MVMGEGHNQPPGVTPLSLLERARHHDPLAWERLVALYRPLVLFWCCRGGMQGADAEDVSQEVFAAAATSLDRFHHDRPGDTFRGWLRGITRNQILMWRRGNRHQPQGQGGSEMLHILQGAADPLGNPDDDEQLQFSELYRRALEVLRPEFEERTWQAFYRTVVDGYSPAALTTELGMTAPAIRQAKSRVLRRLKEEVGDVLA
jgi:RNA polymerase sigma-70 factor (ECF subfamily)